MKRCRCKNGHGSLLAHAVEAENFGRGQRAVVDADIVDEAVKELLIVCTDSTIRGLSRYDKIIMSGQSCLRCGSAFFNPIYVKVHSTFTIYYANNMIPTVD